MCTCDVSEYSKVCSFNLISEDRWGSTALLPCVATRLGVAGLSSFICQMLCTKLRGSFNEYRIILKEDL